MKRILLLTLALSTLHCVDVTLDDGETGVRPTAEFDPARAILPVPNSLLIDPMTGRLSIPEQCGESETVAAIREGVLNQLDGFGTFQPAISMTFSTPPDLDTIVNRLKLYQRKRGDTSLDPLVVQEVPIVPLLSATERYSDDCSSSTSVDNITFIPAVPLEENSTYTAVLLEGLRDETGADYLPAPTWSLVRDTENPVTIENGSIVADRTPLNPANPADRESLLGIDLLWQVHQPVLQFVDAVLEVPREDVLLAWDFKTQTNTTPFDSTTAGSLASMLPTTVPPFNQGGPGLAPLYEDDGDIEAFIEGALGSPGACASLGCAAVETIFAGAIQSLNFQASLPNPLGSEAPDVPGPFPDPIFPPANGTMNVTVTAFMPKGGPPAGGWPVVIYGHGFTRNRNDILAIGSQLAANDIASIALDWVAHGSPAQGGRAVQIDNTSPQCLVDPDPGDTDTGGATCFAPSLSANLGTTRDNLRQSVLDELALVNALQLCEDDVCGTDFNIDPDRIGYMGQSLGGIIGATFVAVSPDIAAAVLNVPAVSWSTIFQYTKRNSFRCPLVDALIEAGVLEGEPLDTVAGTGTCLDDDWWMQPGWPAFANTARWVLDPADGANYSSTLAGRPVLIQEVVGDGVVPNQATAILGALLGLVPEFAAATDGGTIDPSDAITSSPQSPLHLQYPTSPATGGFLGRTYDHGSLLAPVNADPDGQLATQQMQTDAITYLLLGLAP